MPGAVVRHIPGTFFHQKDWKCVMTWEQILWDYLCALYKKLGGKCSDLPPRPSNPTPIPSPMPGTINAVEALYNTAGIPTFANQAEEDEFLALLDSIIAHLNLPGNSLPLASDSQLRSLIAAMRNAVP